MSNRDFMKLVFAFAGFLLTYALCLLVDVLLNQPAQWQNDAFYSLGTAIVFIVTTRR